MGRISNMPMVLHCGSSQSPILYMLDDCGDTSTITDWVETLDGLNPVDETTLIKQGSHSMALGVDADLDVQEYAKWKNTQNQGNLSAYEHDWLYLWVYLPTLDYLRAPLATIQVFVGSNEANRMWWDFFKIGLTIGWNLIKCDLDNPDATAGVVDWTAINYMEIRLYEVLGNTNDFTVYIDSIMFVAPE